MKISIPEPLIRGGGYERGLRAGTENFVGIAAFGAAAAAAQRHFAAEAAHMLALRNRLESGLKAISPHAVIFGEAAGRLPNTTLFGVEGMKAETAVITFELEGIAVSSGAACSSGKVQPAHLLAATEMSPALVRGAVRVSLGWGTGEADIERFLAARRRLANALCRGHSIAA
jgi:cysteine desulfurase